jgi:anion-transporting  ArsA/GET3 family ATPase
MDLNGWLDEVRLIVCVGSGGVGKTTSAAALGLWAAIRGRRVMVLTIDPARRLANSLGLKQFGNDETQIDLSSMEDVKGELWAMMLDSRSTFDYVISKASPNEEVRDRILNSHIYRHMSDTFAGSQDYMATEKLYDLVNSEKYDLVILDTPPVKNALDFLESPGRLVNFLDERVMKWYLMPYDPKLIFGKRLMMGTSAVVFRLLSHVFGRDFLEDLGIFFKDFQELYQGFRERHDSVIEMLRQPTTHFLTVCAPTESSIDVAAFFQEELRRRNLPRAGVIVNQVHECEGEQHDAAEILGDLATGQSEDFGETVRAVVLARLGMAHRRLHGLAEAEERLVVKVREVAVGGGFLRKVPRLEGQVHDLFALYVVGKSIFSRPAEVL